MNITNTYTPNMAEFVPINACQAMLSHKQIVEDILILSTKVCNFIVTHAQKSSILELSRLVGAGLHCGDRGYCQSGISEEETHGKYLEYFDIEQDIEKKHPCFDDKLEQNFLNCTGGAVYLTTLIALLMKCALKNSFADGKITAHEGIFFPPKISILMAKAGGGICKVVQLEFNSLDIGKHTYIIDPLLNGVFDKDEINSQFEKMHFPVYASAETVLEDVPDLTYFIDSYNKNNKLHYALEQANKKIQDSGLEYTIVKNDNVSNSYNSSLQNIFPMINNVIRKILTASKQQAVCTVMPLAEDLSAQLLEDIIEIAADCMSFTYSATAYSSTRALLDIAKMEAVELTEQQISRIGSSPDDYAVSSAYNNIITAYRSFGVIDGNVEISNLAYYMTNVIYNHLTSRHGNCGEMSRLNAILLTFSLEKRLSALGYNASIIKSLKPAISCIVDMSSSGGHSATQLDFVINNRKRSFIIDSFINKVFDFRKIEEVYSDFGNSYYCPKDMMFSVDQNMERLLKYQPFLDNIGSMLLDDFGIDVRNCGNENPFKTVTYIGGKVSNEILINYQPKVYPRNNLLESKANLCTSNG